MTPQLLADSQRLLNEIRKRPQPYTQLKLLTGGDPERTLRALDRLKGLGVIRSRIISRDTHYEEVPDPVV